ncbi:MAG: MBL fold metallo-hydrolase [Cyclobacteriaceae bacterium]
MELTVLGCGDAFASDGRFNTSFMLSENDFNVMIDCGASTLVRVKQVGLSADDIDMVFITHFHGDHYGGLPFLIISKQFETYKSRPLKIVGPTGIESKVRILQDVLYPDTSRFIDEMDIQFIEYQDGQGLEINDLKVLAKGVTHSPLSIPHGIRIEWSDKIFAFSGDTEWDDSIIELSNDADLLIVECNNLAHDSPGHLSYETLRNKSSLLTAKSIFLTHMGVDVIDNEEIAFGKLDDGMILNF